MDRVTNTSEPIGWAYWLNDHWHLCANEPVNHEERHPVYLGSYVDQLRGAWGKLPQWLQDEGVICDCTEDTANQKCWHHWKMHIDRNLEVSLERSRMEQRATREALEMIANVDLTPDGPNSANWRAVTAWCVEYARRTLGPKIGDSHGQA